MENIKVVRYFTFLLLFLFAISFVSAQGCEDQGWKGYSKIYENKTVVITCSTCTFINFTAVNPTQDVFLDNVNMTQSGSTFSYLFLGTNLKTIGTYQVDGYSNLDEPLAFCFDVTMTGNRPSIGTYITILIITILLFMLLIAINLKFNEQRRNQLYAKIVTGYFKKKSGYTSDKNLGTMIMYTLAYGLLKNLFMFYYLIIVFFLFMITELIESFGIVSLTLLLTTILNITLWGFILVFIVMMFSFYELTITILEDIGNKMRGISDDFQ